MLLERHASVTTRFAGKVVQPLVELIHGEKLFNRYFFAQLSHHAADPADPDDHAIAVAEAHLERVIRWGCILSR